MAQSCAKQNPTDSLRIRLPNPVTSNLRMTQLRDLFVPRPFQATAHGRFKGEDPPSQARSLVIHNLTRLMDPPSM